MSHAGSFVSILEQMLAQCAAINASIDCALWPEEPSTQGMRTNNIKCASQPGSAAQPSTLTTQPERVRPKIPPLPLLRPSSMATSSDNPSLAEGIVLDSTEWVRRASESMARARLRCSSADGAGVVDDGEVDALLAVEAEVRRQDALAGADAVSARVVVFGPFKKGGSSSMDLLSSRSLAMHSARWQPRVSARTPHTAGSPQSPMPAMPSVVVTIDQVNT